MLLGTPWILLLEEKIRNVCCIIKLVASNEVCHLGESIYHHHDNILPPRGLGRVMRKSMLMSSKALKEPKEECRGLGGNDS